MNTSTLRRLASDHSSLHKHDLPANFLFPPDPHLPNDLTQLTILLTGPHGTPYSCGLWRLKLSIPEDYPKSPPKAAFRTRIWHPNVDENTGSVCVDTLKKDWEPHLTLRHVLLVISCLLINPNPDSALNSTAGHLLQEDYDAFAQQARLMTSIHARIPSDLKDAVLEAKGRGEKEGMHIAESLDDRPKISRKVASASSVVMKKPTKLVHLTLDAATRSVSAPMAQSTLLAQGVDHEVHVDEDVDEASESKENDPSLSPSPVMTSRPRRSELKKRPLSDLPTPTEEDRWDGGLSPSEKNIIANEQSNTSSTASGSAELQVNHTLVERSQSSNVFNIDRRADDRPAKRVCSDEFKENIDTAHDTFTAEKPIPSISTTNLPVRPPDFTKDNDVPNKAPRAKPAKVRVGLRRL